MQILLDVINIMLNFFSLMDDHTSDLQGCPNLLLDEIQLPQLVLEANNLFLSRIIYTVYHAISFFDEFGRASCWGGVWW